jgi:hypothetical protein
LKIAKDKLQHMVGGAVIAIIVLGVGYHYHMEFYGAYAIISALGAGLAKEYIWDASHPETHTVDIFDAGATFVGGVLAVVAWKLSYAFVVAMLVSYGVQL